MVSCTAHFRCMAEKGTEGKRYVCDNKYRKMEKQTWIITGNRMRFINPYRVKRRCSRGCRSRESHLRSRDFIQKRIYGKISWQKKTVLRKKACPQADASVLMLSIIRYMPQSRGWDSGA